MLGKVWDEITNPFPNVNGAAVKIWEHTLSWVCDYLSLLGFKLRRRLGVIMTLFLRHVSAGFVMPINRLRVSGQSYVASVSVKKP